MSSTYSIYSSHSSPRPSLHPANSSFIIVEEKTLQARNSYRRFKLGLQQRPKILAIARNKRSSQAIDNEKSIIRMDKIHPLFALNSKWAYEDKKEPVEGSELLGRQRQRCKAIGQVIFGFALHKE